MRLSALALGGMALGGGQKLPRGQGKGLCEIGRCYPTSDKTDAYTYAEQLPPFDPLTPVDPDEMRISFIGSAVPPNYRAQEMMSIFVQVGSGGGTSNQPDQAVFDCGSGVCSNYSAMGVRWGQMNKIFISHLHGDHMSDLSFIYQAGPQDDRKTPLFVFGPGPSDFVWTDPDGYQPYGRFDDGTKTFCEMFRAMLRWQSEGFCFQSTGLRPGAPGYLDPHALQSEWGLPCGPVPVTDPRAPWDSRYLTAGYVDDFNDGYAVVPIELKYDEIGGQAYKNAATGLTITHFPVVHTRRGAIGFKVEWDGPDGRRSMIYTSDTKPETNCIEQAKNVDATGEARGVDVFIHEMAVPPEVWAMKIMGLTEPGSMDDPAWKATVDWTKRVQDSSHTPPGAFGHILGRIAPRPRLTVATHFPVTDDTVACALKSVQGHVPDIGRLGEQITWSCDLMVLRVYKDRILQHKAAVSDYSMVSHSQPIPAEDQAPPKYYQYDAAGNKISNPTGQIDPTDTIPATEADGTVNYRDDGY
jgi:ribonuclease Z